MLDIETKRRIDDARDILVGKVPDPKSQVEQITIALIYKFMDDMDAEAEELGGHRKFFSGDYEKYGWKKLMAPGLGGFEVLTLYSEAILQLNVNPNIPQLFRDIFKNAYLPYRDPQTLKSFLKIIDEFDYDHSEKLGDAFEYLLSVLGSQGDAGQFRTPRHIIDFMVYLVDPKKNETILDPACGTAGFLISSYKHIVKSNSSNYQGEARDDFSFGEMDSDKYRGDLLTPDDRKLLAAKLKGYDISPDMVRLSLVNLYLHGFNDPRISEYDTLTSEEKWNEHADVILANPPFMSPKGGIRPHKRFSVESSRSEVLFVDYIAEHLTPNGRAAIIVPEGIVFQSGNAYKALREMLVENYLYAVISLPAGVFNPYSGVKTSILLMDKTLAKKTDKILFAKIENDGFDLGAQRRANGKSELPTIAIAVKDFAKSIIDGTTFDVLSFNNLVIASKDKIGENGDCGLSGDRYKKEKIITSKFNLIKVEDALEKVVYTTKIKTNEYLPEGKFPIIDQSEKFVAGFWNDEKDLFRIAKPVTIFGDHTRSVKFIDFDFVLGADGIKILQPTDSFNVKFFYYLIRSLGITNLGYSRHYKELKEKKIPLPPLDVQKEIVAEIESWQKIIDGARQVVENYKPQIEIDPSWEMVELGEVCEIVRGSSPRPQGDPKYYGGSIPRLMVADITRDGMYTTPRIDFLTEEGAKKSRPMKKGDVIITVSGNPGLPTILATNACIHDGLVGFRNLDIEIISPEFLYLCLLMQKEMHDNMSVGAVFRNLNTDQIKKFRIPKPDVAKQRLIVEKVKHEMDLIRHCYELVRIFEAKVKARIASLWGM